jgi:hypothetical protein
MLTKSLGQKVIVEVEGKTYQGVLHGFILNELEIWFLLENNVFFATVGPVDRARFFCQYHGEQTWSFVSRKFIEGSSL